MVGVTNPPASLLSLPVELLCMILEDLTMFDNHSLRATCKYFRRLLPPIFTLEHPITLDKLYEAAYAWDRARFKLQVQDTVKSLNVCTHCMRLLSRSSFGDEAFCLHTDRIFCVRCGTRPMSFDPYRSHGRAKSLIPRLTRSGRKLFVPYGPGAHLSVEGVPHVFCAGCKRLKACTGSHRSQACDDCLAHRDVQAQMVWCGMEAESHQASPTLQLNSNSTPVKSYC